MKNFIYAVLLTFTVLSIKNSIFCTCEKWRAIQINSYHPKTTPREYKQRNLETKVLTLTKGYKTNDIVFVSSMKKSRYYLLLNNVD